MSPGSPFSSAEARLALIAAVSDRITASEDAAELLYDVSRILGEHLAARRCLFTEIDLANDRGLVRRDYCRGVASVAGVYRISDYAEPTRREMQAGRIVVNRDAATDPRTAADYDKTYAPNGERAYVAVPLLRDGRWVAELWISDDEPRDWNEQDVALLASIAERAWTAVEKLRANAALRESEARMQFIGERAGVGYWYWDVATDHLHWSPVCHRLHGIPENEPVTYARYLEILHPEDRDNVDRAVRAALERGGASDYEVEARVIWPDGSVHWMHGKGSATFENGQPVRMAGIALDITARRTLEREREEASLAKDHFLALLSHELRTPMTTILGWASFIRSGMADAATAERGIESIEQASRVQSRLIDELLDVSRIVTGKMLVDKKVLDVSGVVRNAVEVIQPAAQSASIEVHADLGGGPVFVDGDATRLQQVVWNLLSNAVKFTPAGGRIDVAIADAGDAVEIRV
ncbi:MAG TPA: PAS domain-containing protein, partial [Thermoanaerobaculia bacterium]